MDALDQEFFSATIAGGIPGWGWQPKAADLRLLIERLTNRVKSATERNRPSINRFTDWDQPYYGCPGRHNVTAPGERLSTPIRDQTLA